MEPTTTQRITRSMTQNKKGEEKEEKEKEDDNNRTRLAMKEKFEELEALEASNDAFVTNLTAQITDCPVRMKKASTLPVDLRDDDLNHPFWDPRFFMDPLLNDLSDLVDPLLNDLNDLIDLIDPSLCTEPQLEADIEDVLDQIETSDALAMKEKFEELEAELQLEADIEDVLDQLETSDALAPSPSSLSSSSTY